MTIGLSSINLSSILYFGKQLKNRGVTHGQLFIKEVDSNLLRSNLFKFLHIYSLVSIFFPCYVMLLLQVLKGDPIPHEPTSLT